MIGRINSKKLPKSGSPEKKLGDVNSSHQTSFPIVLSLRCDASVLMIIKTEQSEQQTDKARLQNHLNFSSRQQNTWKADN